MVVDKLEMWFFKALKWYAKIKVGAQGHKMGGWYLERQEDGSIAGSARCQNMHKHGQCGLEVRVHTDPYYKYISGHAVERACKPGYST